MTIPLKYYDCSDLFSNERFSSLRSKSVWIRFPLHSMISMWGIVSSDLIEYFSIIAISFSSNVISRFIACG